MSAISNDQWEIFVKPTRQIILIIPKFIDWSKKIGVKKFVFGFSCSVWFFKKVCNENSKTNPRIEYAKVNLI